jgi:hypothetical protein
MPVVAILAGVAACGGTTPPTEPTVPPRPAVPESWRTITSDREDVTLVVPSDLIVTNTDGAISGFRESRGAAEELIATATGPSRVEQRVPGETVAEWVRRGNLLTAGRGGLGAMAQREVLLPAGSALELSAPWDGGERWTILYVVDTGRGYALLHFDGSGPRPDEPPAEVRLMRELVEFDP